MTETTEYNLPSPTPIALDEVTSPATLDEVIDALRADLGEAMDALRTATEVVDPEGSESPTAQELLKRLG